MPETRVRVESREEAKLLQAGLAHPAVRAMVKLAGALLGLQGEEISARDARRVLRASADGEAPR